MSEVQPEPVNIVVDQGNDEVAIEAAIDAQVTAAIAADEAENAQQTSEAAAELAAVGATVGMAANETATQASEQASEAKSEIAELRDFVQEGFAQIQTGFEKLFTVKEETEKTAVEDVRTDDSLPNEKGAGEPPGSGGSNDDSAGKEGNRSTKTGQTSGRKQGFRRGRR